MPTISINKTEGCQVYLSKDSISCDIVSAKSSAMNILVPVGEDDFVSMTYDIITAVVRILLLILLMIKNIII